MCADRLIRSRLLLPAMLALAACLPAPAAQAQTAQAQTAQAQTAQAQAAQAQAAHKDSSFALVLSVGGGYAHYVVTHSPVYDINRNGLAGTVRLMWYPDHLFRVGFESGWTNLYSYELTGVETSFGVTDTKLRLTAVPLLIVFSMPVGRSVQLFAGTGWYSVNSHTTSFQSTTDVSVLSQGWMLAGAWVFPLSRRLDLTTELKWLGATEFEDAAITLQLQLAWRMVEW